MRSRHPICAARLVLAVAVLAPAVAQERPRIDAALRVKAAGGEPLSVFLVLRDQPQREVMNRIESARASRRMAAEREYSLQAAWGGPFQREGRRERDAVILETRQSAAREIAALIAPQQQAVVARLAELNADRIRRFVAVNMVAARIPATALAALESDPRIAAIGEAGFGEGGLDVSVPALGAPSLWNQGITGAGGSIAIADTGVKTDHPFFAGVNFVNHVSVDYGRQHDTCYVDDGTPEDNVFHGTHVAGIAASRGAAQNPYIGVARGVDTIYNLKVLFNCTGAGAGRYYDSDVIAGLDWLVANTPVTVVNFSAGANSRAEDSYLAKVFDVVADTYGLFVSFCAGNNGADSIWSPAVAYNGVAVANLDDRMTADRKDDVIYSTSSGGPTPGGRFKPDIAAPGTNIASASNTWSAGGLVRRATGTSMASPHIAGSAALLEQMGITNPLAQKALLINTTNSIGWRPDWGWGYANLTTLSTQAVAFVDAVTNAAPSLFRGTPQGTLRATIAWARHNATTQPQFHPLALAMYSGVDGSTLSLSNDPLQNVQQVSVGAASGEVVLAVSGAADEKFGLAVSDRSFTKPLGPALSATCIAPPGPVATATMTVNCTAANGGDLAVFGVAAAFAGSTPAHVGAVPAGGRAAFTASVPTPALGSIDRRSISLASQSYGRNWSWAVEMPIPNVPAAVVGGVAESAAGVTKLSPGILGSIYGTNLAMSTGVATTMPLPVTLGDAWVKINGVPAPVLYADPKQINFQVPYEIPPGQATLTTGVSGSSGVSYTVTVVPAMPAIFQLGGGRAAARNPDSTVNAADNPAARGSYISVYFTGQGALDNPVATGAPAPGTEPLSRAILNSSATIGGVPAEVLYLGLAPGFAGLAQANLRIPDVPPGNVPVVIMIDGVSSNAATISVR